MSNAGKPRGRASASRSAGAGAGGDRRRTPAPYPTQDTPPDRAERRRLTHVDRMGRPRMVDVSDKAATARRAVAEALVVMSQETLTLIIDGHATKGDVMAVAELAGIMGAKRTAELIPLCHPIALTDVGVEITPDRKASALRITAHAATV